MTRQLEIGDAVLPRDEPDHDVMTIYDFKNGFSVALCNWLVGTRMYREEFLARDLTPVARMKRSA